jgi:hypothetical protein
MTDDSYAESGKGVHKIGWEDERPVAVEEFSYEDLDQRDH